MSIFLDVWAHRVETLAKLSPGAFDRIVAFEPSSRCRETLRTQAKRLGAEVCDFGWFDRTCEIPLYHSGEVGATIFQEKSPNEFTQGGETETCRFVEAASWLAESIPSTEVEIYLKLNVEGAEVAILRNLAEQGALRAGLEIALDWDILKVPGREKYVERLLQMYPMIRKHLVSDEWSSNYPQVLQRWGIM